MPGRPRHIQATKRRPQLAPALGRCHDQDRSIQLAHPELQLRVHYLAKLISDPDRDVRDYPAGLHHISPQAAEGQTSFYARSINVRKVLPFLISGPRRVPDLDVEVIGSHTIKSRVAISSSHLSLWSCHSKPSNAGAKPFGRRCFALRSLLRAVQIAVDRDFQLECSRTDCRFAPPRLRTDFCQTQSASRQFSQTMILSRCPCRYSAHFLVSATVDRECTSTNYPIPFKSEHYGARVDGRSTAANGTG